LHSGLLSAAYRSSIESSLRVIGHGRLVRHACLGELFKEAKTIFAYDISFFGSGQGAGPGSSCLIAWLFGDGTIILGLLLGMVGRTADSAAILPDVRFDRARRRGDKAIKRVTCERFRHSSLS
jgi:hypothetical protein